jgi:phosphohistidine phosphatase
MRFDVENAGRRVRGPSADAGSARKRVVIVLARWHLAPVDLYLMRHGEAGDVPGPAGGFRSDAERPLTPRGLAQATASAHGLKRLNVKVPVIHHSPYLRATQTAAAVAAVFGSRLVVDDGLTPAASPDAAAEALCQLREGAFVVAHMPILPGIIDRLCGARVNFPTAAVAQILVSGGSGVLGGLWTSDLLERVR